MVFPALCFAWAWEVLKTEDKVLGLSTPSMGPSNVDALKTCLIPILNHYLLLSTTFCSDVRSYKLKSSIRVEP